MKLVSVFVEIAIGMLSNSPVYHVMTSLFNTKTRILSSVSHQNKIKIGSAPNPYLNATLGVRIVIWHQRICDDYDAQGDLFKCVSFVLRSMVELCL